ncbi:BTAD domain-containing putative transcriptional regulator [Fodinicola feengrottensis]|uniref:BTAD domain-containing putative transcriptional regulator n=1 Tax=Fodinicola feengrottensis TaxID=435914 RepID=A0ABP4RYK5_9ACTN
MLGPVRARCDGTAVDVGPARQQAVLAVLAMRAGSPVSAAELLRAGWGDRPPAIGDKVVPAYVYRLRKALAAAGAGELLGRTAGGYVLRVSPAAVDSGQFTDQVAQASRCRRDGDPERAERLLTSALTLWRGEALAGLPGPFAEQQRSRLSEQRVAAREDLLDLRLRGGNCGDAVGELTALVAEHPLRERGVELLMTALYWQGRQAEALAVYARARRILVDELGVEPGDHLRATHRAILRAELPRPATETSRTAETFPVRKDIPAPPPGFVGRTSELALISQLTSGVCAVDGMAGVGKTAFLLRAAAQHDCADGQLYLDLCGYTLERRPLRPTEALDRLLRAVGATELPVTDDPDELAATWRARVAGRRLLLVLDNAVNAEQVRPLLPGDGGSVVLVSSRRRLGGLEVDRHLHLGVPPLGDAVRLLENAAARECSGTDRAEAIRVVQTCGRLPLALRIVGAKLRHRPALGLADLVDHLRDHDQRLGQLEIDDRRIDVVFEMSYAQLDPGDQQAFRLLGLLGTASVDRYVLAALAGVDGHRADLVLERLLAANLVDEPAPGRFVLHDLVRSYAAQTTRQLDPDRLRRDALTRLFDYYLAASARAYVSIQPATAVTGGTSAGMPLPAAVDDFAGAQAWFEREAGTLGWLVDLAAVRPQWHAYGWQLANPLVCYLTRHGRQSDAARAGAAGLAAAIAGHHRQGLAVMLFWQATVRFDVADYAEAERLWTRSLDLYEQLGDLAGQARALRRLAECLQIQGQLRRAFERAQRAVDIARRAYDERAVCTVLQTLGIIGTVVGEFAAAEAALVEATANARARDDLNRLGFSLVVHAMLQAEQGRAEDALRTSRAAEQIATSLGNPTMGAMALTYIAVAHRMLGETAAAVAGHRRALDLVEAHLLRAIETTIRNAFGQTLCLVGEVEQARRQHEAALALATVTAEPYEQALALGGLASCAQADGDAQETRRWRTDALTMVAGFGLADNDSAPLRRRIAGTTACGRVRRA